MAVRVCCGDSVFKASPSAPASSAERSESPSLSSVRTSPWGGDGGSRGAAITAVPLMLVSSRSSTTTSGLCCWTSFTTSGPSVVQAATLMSASPSSSPRSPSSTIAWSSARRTRITAGWSLRRQGDGERRAAPGGAVDRERATQHGHAILDPPQPEVSALHADVRFTRQHPLGVEALAVVRDRQGDGAAAPVDRQPLARGPRVTVAVGECFLQDAVDRDLGRERAVAEVGREVELDPLVGERLVLHGQALDDLAQRAALKARRPKRPDEVADLAERALQQLHRLTGALLRHGIAGERALQHLKV